MNETSIARRPDVPSLIFRPLQVGDAEGLLAVQKSRAAHDRIDPLSTFEHVPTLEQVTWWVSHHAEAQRLDQVLVAEVNGAVVGYTWLDWWTEMDGLRLFLSQAALMPKWCGQGIGTAMLHWAEERLRVVASGQTEIGAAFFGANATEMERDDAALLLDAGYRRSFAVVELERGNLNALPHMSLPEGIVIRPIMAEHFLAVGRSVTECYSESLFSIEPSDDQDQKQSRWLSGFEPSLCFVAWAGEEVAGQVLCRIEKGRGEMAEVSIRKPWRRRGLAKALLAEAASGFS